MRIRISGRISRPKTKAAPEVPVGCSGGESARGHGRQALPLGFTLLELLVVIGILALLASLLLPALGRARATAQFAACKSNLRQMGIAVQIYVNESGAYPGWWFGNYPAWYPIGAGTIAWQQIIRSELQYRFQAASNAQLGVLVCPGSFGSLPAGLGYGYNYGGVAALFGSDPSRRDQFGLAGAMLAFPVRTAADVQPVRESQVRHPSQMLALGDVVGVWTTQPGSENPHWSAIEDLSFATGAGQLIYNGQDASYPVLIRRHKFLWNTAFCDGHVAGYKPRQLFDMHNPEIRKLWNNDNQPHPEFPPYL